MKMLAVRNLRLCTKDCLCLYVCPTGATDTEDSIIDLNKCIGCGMCADACPSKAISMVPEEYPPQQKKAEHVLTLSHTLANNKAKAEGMARLLAREAESGELYRLLKAVERSLRLVNEDLLREAGYMLPQSANTHELLASWVQEPPAPDFPVEAAKKLLELLPCNEPLEKKMHKYRCTVCGYIHEAEELPPDFSCPVCRQPASAFERIE